MAEPVAALLRRSLRHLADEVPDSYRLLADRLGSVTVGITVDGEAFTVRVRHGRVDVGDGPAATPGIHIGASRAVVLDVLDGALGLAEAVESDRVRVRGSLDDVVRTHDALLAYAHAAVRAPSAPGLLAALRDGTAGAR